MRLAILFPGYDMTACNQRSKYLTFHFTMAGEVVRGFYMALRELPFCISHDNILPFGL